MRKTVHMSIKLEIAEDISEVIQLPETEKPERLKLELAFAFYAQWILNAATAARLAGLTRLDFLDEAGKRGIPRHYTTDNLREDLAYADGCQ